MKSLDFFPKMHQDQHQQHVQRTVCGGLLFVGTLVLILTLIMNELYLALIKGELVVQSFVEASSMDLRVRVNLNISFLQIPCHALSLDLQDVTGAHLEDVSHTLHKLRLHDNGTFINQQTVQKLASLERYVNYPSNPIFKIYKKWKNRREVAIDECYGAQLYEGQKCITCQDVMLAYSAREWPQPPRESVAQCMPDKKAKMQKFTFQREFQQILSDQQDEILEDLSQEFLDVEQREKEIQIYKQELELKRKAEGVNDTQNTSSSQMKELLSPLQKKNFIKTLSELQEISQNPMQWNEERIQEEKLFKVESLIKLLNVSLDDYTVRLQQQIRFFDRDMVVTERKLSHELTNLTILTRQKCDQETLVDIQVSGLDDNLNQTHSIVFKSGICNISVSYICTQINDDFIKLKVNIGDQVIIIWDIKRNKVSSLLTNLILNITNVTQNDGSKSKSRTLIDLAKRSYRLSVYIPLRSIIDREQTRLRLLYQEDFSVRPQGIETLDPSDASDIQEHLGEGCQLFGHLFIRRVPGNLHLGFHGRGEAARLLSNQFSIAHILHLLEFTDEKEELSLSRYIKSTNPLDDTRSNNQVDEDSIYYLKIVGSILNSMWGTNSRIYTFTAHDKKTHSKEKLPAVIFRYEFDAITMSYSSKIKSFVDLIVSILAIIGGVFAVSSLFSKILESLSL